MSRRLGVDLSSTHAALASVRQTRQGLQLRGFFVFEAEGDVEAIAADLRQARRAHGFPRAAEVVAWPGDSRVEAVRRAGCRVEHVITPGEALTRVARLHHRGRPATGVTAVVSLHLTAGAIALVREGRLLMESRLDWSVAATLAGADSELLRRYTFVSELTEGLRGVFDAARTKHAAQVSEILTCGSLADLRSLTMPLAAEFDVEVETLDSTDDVDIRVRGASPQQVRDTIASLRVAIAAGTGWHRRSAAHFLSALRLPGLSPAIRAGAIAVTCVLALSLWMRFDRPAAPQRAAARSAASAPASQAAPAQTDTRSRSGAVALARAGQPPPAARVIARPPSPPIPATRSSAPVAPAAPAVATSQRSPAAPTPHPAGPARATVVASPVAPESPVRASVSPEVTRPVPRPATSSSPTPTAVKPSPDLSVKPITSVARAAAPPTVAGGQQRQRPSKSGVSFLPAPADVVVTSILWSSDRQLAVVNSRIVGVGDTVGTDTVVEVQADGVVFRDRAGRLRHAALRKDQPEGL